MAERKEKGQTRREIVTETKVLFGQRPGEALPNIGAFLVSAVTDGVARNPRREVEFLKKLEERLFQECNGGNSSDREAIERWNTVRLELSVLRRAPGEEGLIRWGETVVDTIVRDHLAGGFYLEEEK